MADVYAWPPVAAIGSEWTEIAPIDESFSGITGKRYASSNQPVRRAATLTATALGRGRNGAGYMEALKRLLRGGEAYVRLTSYPINWHLDTYTELQSVAVYWTDGGTDLNWTDGGTELLWYDGTIITGTTTTSGGFPALSLSGCPANTLIVRPGDFLTVFQDDTTFTTVQAIAPATSNGSGVAIVRLFEAAPYGGRVNVGTSETAVFRVVGDLPRSVQPVNQNWSYSWSFEEVFSDEVGGFTEFADWWQAT